MEAVASAGVVKGRDRDQRQARITRRGRLVWFMTLPGLAASPATANCGCRCQVGPVLARSQPRPGFRPKPPPSCPPWRPCLRRVGCTAPGRATGPEFHHRPAVAAVCGPWGGTTAEPRPPARPLSPPLRGPPTDRKAHEAARRVPGGDRSGQDRLRSAKIRATLATTQPHQAKMAQQRRSDVPAEAKFPLRGV